MRRGGRWLMLGLCLLGAACGPPERAAAPVAGPELGEARQTLETWRRRQEAGLALCQLASLAAPSAPDLALGMYQQALEWGRLGLGGGALIQAERLAARAADLPEAGRGEALALAGELEEAGRAAWPLGLVADGAQVVSPALAEQALVLGVKAAQENPRREQGQRELIGLALLAARQSPARGEQLAGGVGDARLKAWFLRDLAALHDSGANRQAALAAARALEDPGQRALALARLALLVMTTDGQSGRETLQAAMAAAGREREAETRALLQGEVAACAAQADPGLGLEMTAQVEAWPGAKIKALRLASAQLIPSDPNRARAGLEAAWREAQGLPLLGRRLRTQSLLIQDMALLDPRRGREMLGELPPEGQAWRAEALAALILAQAGKSLTHALEQARALPPGETRGLLLARLAGLALRQEGELARAVLEEAAPANAPPPGDHLGQALALAWARLDAGRAIALAQGIGDLSSRVKALTAVAKSLAGREETAAAQWALRLAENSLPASGPKEAIDKVRLLGHMGREWSTVEATKSRRFFQQGVEAATQLGETRKGPG